MALRHVPGLVLVCLLATACDEPIGSNSSLPGGDPPPAPVLFAEEHTSGASSSSTWIPPLTATRPTQSTGGGTGGSTGGGSTGGGSTGGGSTGGGSTGGGSTGGGSTGGGSTGGGSTGGGSTGGGSTGGGSTGGGSTGGGSTGGGSTGGGTVVPGGFLPLSDMRPAPTAGSFHGGQWSPLPAGWTPPAINPEPEPGSGGQIPRNPVSPPPQQPVPEPETVVLFSLGMLGAGYLAWRKRHELFPAGQTLA
jgi:hypothetical protein